MPGRKVTVGGDPRTIQEFNTRKTDAVFAILEQIGPQYVEVLQAADDFQREWADTHPAIRVDRQVAIDALAAARDNEDAQAVAVWDELLAEMGQRKSIERPARPDQQVMVAAVVPKVMGRVRPQLVTLLGLIAIPHDQLKDAARNGGIDDAIHAYGNDLYDDTTPAEAIGILSAGVSLFLADWEANRERLGKLWTTTETALFGDRDSEPEATSDPDSASSRSTDSAALTTGPPKSSSTTSPTGS